MAGGAVHQQIRYLRGVHRQFGEIQTAGFFRIRMPVNRPERRLDLASDPGGPDPSLAFISGFGDQDAMPDESEDDCTLRSARNEYEGNAYGPMKRTGPMRLRLDFNSVINVDPEDGGSKLKGFNLRIMERPEDVAFPEKRSEFGVHLTVEQWQDLISAMQEELKLARKYRDEFEKLDSPGDDWGES